MPSNPSSLQIRLLLPLFSDNDVGGYIDWEEFKEVGKHKPFVPLKNIYNLNVSTFPVMEQILNQLTEYYPLITRHQISQHLESPILHKTFPLTHNPI